MKFIVIFKIILIYFTEREETVINDNTTITFQDHFNELVNEYRYKHFKIKFSKGQHNLVLIFNSKEEH